MSSRSSDRNTFLDGGFLGENNLWEFICLCIAVVLKVPGFIAFMMCAWIRHVMIFAGVFWLSSMLGTGCDVCGVPAACEKVLILWTLFLFSSSLFFANISFFFGQLMARVL